MTSGILTVDKPQGVTSHDIVAAARHALHTKKVGHAGTLDPMATGELVIGFGNATRLLNYIVEHNKTYVATIRFGVATTTDDADGDIVGGSAFGMPVGSGEAALNEAALNEAALNEAALNESALNDSSVQLPTVSAVISMIAQRFLGTIQQIPNTFSAIKINGQRAYDLAREGKDVELKAREVVIEQFDVLGAREVTAEYQMPGESSSSEEVNGVAVLDVDVRVTCSAGTYIRALARDLGIAFGCGAHLTMLRRERVGEFSVDDPRTVTAHVETKSFTNRDGELVTRNRAVLDIPHENADEFLAAHTLTMAQAVAKTMPVIAVTAEQAKDLRFGRFITVHTQPQIVTEDAASSGILVPNETGDDSESVLSESTAADVAASARLHGPAAAVVVDDVDGRIVHIPPDADVVAVVERKNRTQWKPLAVFPTEH